MRTVVLGAGVVGVTSAYYLAKEGHEVVVVDRCSQVGQDATGGNAGLIAPGHSFAWASPKAPGMLLRSLRGEATAIRVRPSADPRFLWWGMQFLRECTGRRARVNTLAKLALCRYSQAELNKLSKDESIEFHHAERGVVYVYDDAAALELGIAKMELLREHGQELSILDADGLSALDPAFAGNTSDIGGAIHAVTDASGNSELFTRELRSRCESMGVEFRLGSTVMGLEEVSGRIRAVRTDGDEIRGDSYVLALGVQSPFISRTVGQNLPVYPAKGYSLTADVNPDSAPTIGGVDEATLVAWSRLGNELRMSATAEFDRYNRDHRPADFDNMLKTARRLFPDAADWDTARMRSCLRPMTPDGPPIIGRGRRHENLYYNTGHGHMGWTMACGSSRALADTVAGRRPSVAMDAFAVRSFRR